MYVWGLENLQDHGVFSSFCPLRCMEGGLSSHPIVTQITDQFASLLIPKLQPHCSFPCLLLIGQVKKIKNLNLKPKPIWLSKGGWILYLSVIMLKIVRITCELGCADLGQNASITTLSIGPIPLKTNSKPRQRDWA